MKSLRKPGIVFATTLMATLAFSLMMSTGAALSASTAQQNERAAAPPTDKDMAQRYLRAAQAGDSTAQFYLGALHSGGVGAPQSDRQAFEWISRAAEQGHAQAMLIVGGLYVTGRGTPKDYIKGYKWSALVMATANVDEFRTGARQLMTLLESRMTRDEIRAARAEADAWQPQPPRMVTASNQATREQAPTIDPAANKAKDNNKDNKDAKDNKDNKDNKASDEWLNRIPKKWHDKLGF
jgi:hypothetical protein